MNKWTLNTVWYLFLPVMEKFEIKVTRAYIKRLVKEICEAAGISRESLGIFAGVRAELYFDGQWTSVSFDRVKGLAEKGTDIIFVEKEGITEVLTDLADKYGIAMVNTRGHLTEYGKDLTAWIETLSKLNLRQMPIKIPLGVWSKQDNIRMVEKMKDSWMLTLISWIKNE